MKLLNYSLKKLIIAFLAMFSLLPSANAAEIVLAENVGSQSTIFKIADIESKGGKGTDIIRFFFHSPNDWYDSKEHGNIYSSDWQHQDLKITTDKKVKKVTDFTVDFTFSTLKSYVGTADGFGVNYSNLNLTKVSLITDGSGGSDSGSGDSGSGSGDSQGQFGSSISSEAPAANCLCFTAKVAGSKIQLQKVGSPSGLNGFEVNVGGKWYNYDYSEITLANANDKVYFRAKAAGNSALYTSESAYCRFKMAAGSFDASGGIGYLIDKNSPEWFTFTDYQFCGLFKDCARLYAPPYLPAQQTLSDHCYESLFENCSNLTATPGFGSATGDFDLKNRAPKAFCFMNMFKGCSSITELVGGLLANNNMQESCYEGMFQDCISLITAPEIQGDNYGGDMIAKYALNAAPSCFKNMFNGCWKMTNIQGRLGATTMYASCYEGMYMGCRSLKNGPDLPATTLAPSCYASMFEGCSSLEAAPDLVAKTLVTSCYESMFSDCRNLKYISVDFSDWNEDNDATTNWVYNVAPKGVFMGPDAITAFPIYNKSHVPEGWNCSTPEFLCFEIKSIKENQAGNAYVQLSSGQNLSFKYRVDRKNSSGVYVAGNWTQKDILYNNLQMKGPDGSTPQVGDRIYIKSVSQDGTLNTSDKTHKFTFNNLTVEVSGNVMSLIDYTMTRKDVPAYTFRDLFSGSGNQITDIKELRMPATELGDYCYENMFKGCTSITVAPVLPAMNLGVACYKTMYKGCTSLLTPPSLPATTLKNNCYESMFEDCSALKVAPHLPAKTLVTGCYNYLFKNCSNLHYISVEFPNWDKWQTCTYRWVEGVASTGTFAHPNGLSRDCPSVLEGDRYCKWPRQLSAIWGSEVFGQDAVCFMATTSGVGLKVRMVKKGNVGTVKFNFDTKEALASGSDGVITFSGTGDQSWEIGDSHLNGAGKSVFINANGTNGPLYIDENNYVRFEIVQTSGAASVDMRGNIMSLLKADCSITTVPDKAFAYLFKNCKNLRSTPNLPSTKIGKRAYEGMFQNCSGLISTPILKSTTLSEACYAYMFDGCTGLKFIDGLPATKMEKGCYEYMFKNCDGLTQEPVLKATILADYCYRGMFEGCDNLKKSPALEASTMFPHCYEDMFKDCKNLQAAPELASTRLAPYCYSGMLSGTAIKRAPELPATYLTDNDYCYAWMFKNCKEMTVTPVLVAKALSTGCYYGMFEGCTSVSSAPDLPALTLVKYCYREMFKDCGSNFTSMKVSFTEWPDADLQATEDWVLGVANRGSFVCPKLLGDTEKFGSNYIPRLDENGKRWVVINDFLCFTNQQYTASTISLTIPDGFKLLYSTNDIMKDESEIEPWKTYSSGKTITLTTYGDKVFFKAPARETVDGVEKEFVNSGFSSKDKYYSFIIPASSSVSVSGHLLSLLKENYTDLKGISAEDKNGNFTYKYKTSYIFYMLFNGCEGLRDASNLKIPGDLIGPHCYRNMFSICKNMTKAPALPATTLANYCYASMFKNCYALQEAPALPATTLAERCYGDMFAYCKELLVAPKLPAPKVATECYYNMFNKCRSLKSAPKLEAITLDAPGCYKQMFQDCIKLKQIDVNFIDWNPKNYDDANMPTKNWVAEWGGKKSTGEFRCPTQLPTGNGYVGVNYVPLGWLPGLNIIATIPDDNGEIPAGYPTVDKDGKDCTDYIKHHYIMGAEDDADVLYLTGENKITITTPHYARVLEIGIYGTTSDNEQGHVTVIKNETNNYACKNDSILNKENATPGVEVVYVIDNQAEYTNQDQIIHTFTLEFDHGFVGKITLYGEAHPYCEAPVINFDYVTNELTLSAEAGATIYYSDNEEDLYASTIDPKFIYNGSPVYMDWVEGAEGYIEKTYYAVAINAGKDKSITSQKTIAGYGPKMGGYCLVNENDGDNLREALKYAKYASSYNYPVKIYVPDGTYDVGAEPLEIKDYVSLIGESCANTRIEGSGESVILVSGNNSYLQDMTVDHTNGGTAVYNMERNTLKIQIADGDKYEDDMMAPRPNWNRSDDSDQINVNGASCNGHAIHARYPRGASEPEPTAFLVTIIKDGIAEGYAIIEGNDFYIKENLSQYKISVRAANEKGGFGMPYLIESQTQHEAEAETVMILEDDKGNKTRLKLNAYGYATFSFDDGVHAQLQAIGASAYYALYQNEKVRLEQINNLDIIPAGTGVVLFGAPNDYVDFYTCSTSVSEPTESVLVAVTAKDYPNGWLNNKYGAAYVLNDNKIKKLKDGGKVSPNRAYFDLGGSHAGAASYRMVFGRWFDDEAEFENEATGIEIIKVSRPAIEVLETGIYNLAGQKTTIDKGLLIKNGKVILQK